MTLFSISENQAGEVLLERNCMLFNCKLTKGSNTLFEYKNALKLKPDRWQEY